MTKAATLSSDGFDLTASRVGFLSVSVSAAGSANRSTQVHLRLHAGQADSMNVHEAATRTTQNVSRRQRPFSGVVPQRLTGGRICQRAKDGPPLTLRRSSSATAAGPTSPPPRGRE